ncbi:MAG: R3H domain-containing nucleic acid-binding protein [Candidatus Dormiibacterota bacterium]
MSSSFHEASGLTVEEAVQRALSEAGLAPEDASVEIVSAGAPVIAGERLTGAQARVRVSPLPPDARQAREHLELLLRLMGVEATVEASLARASDGDLGTPTALLEVEGDDLGILIGWRGESLRALQTVLNLMLGGEPGRARVIVDVAHYRERRERAVSQIATRVAEVVARTGRPQSLSPMPPYERRAVHLALAGHPAVTTESSGVDEERHVVVRPAQPGQPERPGGGWN